ncbi:Uncharacterised protein [Vibrio cholerae]|nr:Uncharacterised protein [Vibrio cholerae]
MASGQALPLNPSRPTLPYQTEIDSQVRSFSVHRCPQTQHLGNEHVSL